MNINEYIPDDEIEWSVKDYRSGTVSLSKKQLKDHIQIEHPEMIPKMDAVKATIQDPDDVYQDISEHAETNSQVFYKQTELLGTDKFRVKVAIAYSDATLTEGFVKTTHKVDLKRRKAESDDLRIYHKEK